MTSLATTAKPLPISPARAASMVALSASGLVCSAIELMSFTTLPISWLETPSWSTVRRVVSASATASWATLTACWALREISPMEAPISSEAAARVCTFSETWLAVQLTPRARAAASAAELEMRTDVRSVRNCCCTLMP